MNKHLIITAVFLTGWMFPVSGSIQAQQGDRVSMRYPLYESLTKSQDDQVPEVNALDVNVYPEVNADDVRVEVELTPQEKASRASIIPLANRHVVGQNTIQFREQIHYEIDPDQSCNQCANSAASRSQRGSGLKGHSGRPHVESATGGCQCGNRNCRWDSPMQSAYWPRPYSAKLDNQFPRQASERYSPYPKHKPQDFFDRFDDFRLIGYTRSDNGYCGEDSDPYGCLGESRQAALVAGVEFRAPGQPAAVPPISSRVQKMTQLWPGAKLFHLNSSSRR